MERLLQAVDQALKAFGSPGDWGYGTPMGDALMELHRARAECEDTIARVLREAEQWRARENEAQEALRAIGEVFGVLWMPLPAPPSETGNG